MYFRRISLLFMSFVLALSYGETIKIMLSMTYSELD